MASAEDQVTEFKTTEFKDHQETMFEDPTSFAIPEEETSQEVPENLDPSHDSLPDEEPDTVHNQILFPDHSSDIEPVPEPDPPPVLVGSHQGTNPLPRAQFAPAPSASEVPVLAGQEFMPPPVEAMPMAPPPPAEEAPPPQPDLHAEPAPESVSEPAPLAMSMDDFAALEERVLRAVTLVRREREARLAAEERLMQVESQLLAQAPVIEHSQQLQQEVDALRAERDQVRQRVERLLGQLDALEL